MYLQCQCQCQVVLIHVCVQLTVNKTFENLCFESFTFVIKSIISV